MKLLKMEFDYADARRYSYSKEKINHELNSTLLGNKQFIERDEGLYELSGVVENIFSIAFMLGNLYVVRYFCIGLYILDTETHEYADLTYLIENYRIKHPKKLPKIFELKVHFSEKLAKQQGYTTKQLYEWLDKVVPKYGAQKWGKGYYVDTSEDAGGNTIYITSLFLHSKYINELADRILMIDPEDGELLPNDIEMFRNYYFEWKARQEMKKGK